MKITNCTLGKPFTYDSELGWRVVFSLRKEELLIDWLNGNTVVAKDAVDYSQQIDVESIYLIESEKSPYVLVVGGQKAYYLSEIECLFAFDLPRIFGDLAEYASVQFLATTQNLLCVFETGLCLIDAELKLVWCVEKSVSDHFEKIIGNEVVLTHDHDELWRISLQSGQRI